MQGFSIIIPFYNSEEHIMKCIHSVTSQVDSEYTIEIIVVDDCSTDSSVGLLEELILNNEIQYYKTKKNSGPGVARNIGIENSTGDWILFLDADDTLDSNALSELSRYIVNSPSQQEAIGFNWCYERPLNDNSEVLKDGRFDFDSLKKDKHELILDYVSLGMDGSAIYTLISSSLLKNKKIYFSGGVHEDVDFIFKVYFYATRIGVLDYPVYLKDNRAGSIVNSISTEHVNGFFRAFAEIYEFLEINKELTDEVLRAYYVGIIGVVVTLLRKTISFSKDHQTIIILLDYIYASHLKIRQDRLSNLSKPVLNTRFGKIYNYFIRIMESKGGVNTDNISNFCKNIQELAVKSWSCYDLHHSVFLGPDEVRTCCKRFFVDKKLKGDVVILKPPKYRFSEFTLENILKEKNSLLTSINKDVSEECSGCPFLEYKDWGPIEVSKIEHVSFEYHSNCNMECVYCSDTYYGGKSVQYDINSVVENLFNNRAQELKSVVWGGGEPTVDKGFKQLLQTVTEYCPDIKQRVITNATKFVPLLDELLVKNKVSLTTSIDAGTEEVFREVRKSKKFEVVFRNLKKYASSRPENITIKYIFLDENSSLAEVQAFVEKVEKHGLLGCNFQISFDFNKDKVSLEAAVAMIALYSLLVNLKANLVFLDDLLRARFQEMSDEYYNELLTRLDEVGFLDGLADGKKYSNLIIWGAGLQTEYLIRNSMFLKNACIQYIVDDNPDKIGSKFHGYEVKSPDSLFENDYPILISAVQNTPFILKRFNDMQLNEARLIKSLVI